MMAEVQRFGLPSLSTSAKQDVSSLPIVEVYESSTGFLKEMCSRTNSDSSRLQLSMAADNIVNAIVDSVTCRRVLLQLSSDLGLANDWRWRNALQLDERRIATHLKTIFDSRYAEGLVLVLKGESAQCFLDVIQDTLNRGLLVDPEQSRKARRIIRKLSEASETLPSSLFVTGVSTRDPHPLFAGGYGDIYRAEYNTKTVALKHMRYFTQTSDLRDIRLKLCREALVWKDLHHPNILAFVGIDRESFPGSLCLVSPWMEHGTVLKYLNDHGRENVDKLLFEVAQGLQYLHSHHVVHGDLRGANILINDNWSACLADFGLSVLASATASVHASTRAGSPYWMAPELIDPPRFGCRYARTPASDIYAFGCVCLELYIGRPPFSEHGEVGALLKVVNGERAERPAEMVSGLLWERITSYWAQIAAKRPLSEVVVREMTWPPNSMRKPSSPVADPESRSHSFHDALARSEENSVVSEVGMTLERAIAFDNQEHMKILDDGRLDDHEGDKNSTVSYTPPQPLQGAVFAPPNKTNKSRRTLQLHVVPSPLLLTKPPLPETDVEQVHSYINAQHTARSLPEGASPPVLGPIWSSYLSRAPASEPFVTPSNAWETPTRHQYHSPTDGRSSENVCVQRSSGDSWGSGPDDRLSVQEAVVNDVTQRPRAIFQSMKKLFRRGKPEVPTLQVSTQPTPFPAPVQFAPTQRTRESPDDDAWEAAFAEEDDASIENWSTVGVYPDDRPTTPETPPIAAKQPRKRTDSHVKRRDKDHHPGIIPLDEDIRRLFQECKIGVGNANLLSETLVTATPEDLRNPAISEFYKDCINSQELIFAQIPWASAGAERSRAAAELNGSLPDISTSVSTREEELFAELLAANEHLLEAIDLYKDLERVALERDAEERSRREARMDLARSRRIYWALIT